MQQIATNTGPTLPDVWSAVVDQSAWKASQGQHCSKIMKLPQSLPLQMVERLLRAQPDLVANHVTARAISD